MSPQNPSLIVGLAAPGLLWLATSVALGQAPPAAARPPSPAPSIDYRRSCCPTARSSEARSSRTPPPASTASASSGGTVPYPRSMVEKAAGSVEELYRFRVARLPVRDPDERIKLARWCLTEHLPAQAREQLVAVKAMSPGDPEVKRMLFNLDAAAEPPGVDPEVRRTSGESPPARPRRPRPPGLVRPVQKRFNALPVIFDLPPAQAVRRAGEFADVRPADPPAELRPVPQRAVPGRRSSSSRSRPAATAKNPDIARANLDATLRLVNPDDPARSDLLSAGLVPHGGEQERHLPGAERPPVSGPGHLGQEPPARPAAPRRPTPCPGPTTPPRPPSRRRIRGRPTGGTGAGPAGRAPGTLPGMRTSSRPPGPPPRRPRPGGSSRSTTRRRFSPGCPTCNSRPPTPPEALPTRPDLARPGPAPTPPEPAPPSPRKPAPAGPDTVVVGETTTPTSFPG